MAIFRLMGIDFGEVRIGIALSDPLRIIAQPYKVIPNDQDTISEIKKIIKTKEIGKIILGLPQNIKGEDTKKTLEVREFSEILRKNVDIPVIFWDESYTSVEANEELKQKKLSISESRKIIDKIAASIILRRYMEDQV
ncbi:MAG: Holliday junction resolvase RuvX [Candidatus Tenebribacter davisii]|jgi:putative Holliday junction resolvase|nr:Holliday junction resolvase RuvX [Candidatus Tenebribacter davisii]